MMAMQRERSRPALDEEFRRRLSRLRDQWSREDRRQHQTVEQLRRARARLEQRQSIATDRRRTEDRIREELRDSRAVTISASQRPAGP
jgi:hypothetical protein